MIQGEQHVVLNHALDHVVRGEGHVVGGAALFQLDVHFLVGGKAHVVDLDAGFFLKEVDHLWVDVVLPVVDGDGVFRAGAQPNRSGRKDRAPAGGKGTFSSFFGMFLS